MIQVSKSQLKQIEYFIAQSLQGNHVLFDSASIREAFSSMNDLTEAEAYASEPHVERLLLSTSLSERRAYLDHLDPGTRQSVVKTYFSMVENNLYESKQVRH